MQVKDKVLDGVGKYFVAHGLGLFFWCWVGGGVGEEDRRLRKEKLPLQYLENSRSLVYMQIIHFRVIYLSSVKNHLSVKWSASYLS